MKYLLEVYLFVGIIAYFVLAGSYKGDTDRWEKAFWQATVWPVTAVNKIENND